MDIFENRSSTFVHVTFEQQDGLEEALEGAECLFEYAANHGLWYPSEVLPATSWAVALQQVGPQHYVCPLSHQNLTTVVALVAGLSSESLFLGLDIVRLRPPASHLAGSFALGHHGSEAVRKSVINPRQGKVVEEMKQWRPLPLLLVPVDWPRMLDGLKLLPELAVVEQDDLLRDDDVSFSVECPAMSARRQYLLYQILPKQ